MRLGKRRVTKGDERYGRLERVIKGWKTINEIVRKCIKVTVPNLYKVGSLKQFSVFENVILKRLSA